MKTEHKISTIQDMINATSVDNIDNFLSDLREFLFTAYTLNKISDDIGCNPVESDGLLWIDDGKKELSITIQQKEKTKDSIAKRIILEELEEQAHPERVEDVILWALKYYAENHKTTWGGAISHSIFTRIDEEEYKLGEMKAENKPS